MLYNWPYGWLSGVTGMIKFSEDKNGNYSSECGLQIKREHGGETPNGNSFGGKWVLRDK